MVEWIELRAGVVAVAVVAIVAVVAAIVAELVVEFAGKKISIDISFIERMFHLFYYYKLDVHSPPQ